MNLDEKIQKLKEERKILSSKIEELETEMLEANPVDVMANATITRRWLHLSDYKKALIDNIFELKKIG